MKSQPSLPPPVKNIIVSSLFLLPSSFSTRNQTWTTSASTAITGRPTCSTKLKSLIGTYRLYIYIYISTYNTQLISTLPSFLLSLHRSLCINYMFPILFVVSVGWMRRSLATTTIRVLQIWQLPRLPPRTSFQRETEGRS